MNAPAETCLLSFRRGHRPPLLHTARFCLAWRAEQMPAQQQRTCREALGVQLSQRNPEARWVDGALAQVAHRADVKGVEQGLELPQDRVLLKAHPCLKAPQRTHVLF